MFRMQQLMQKWECNGEGARPPVEKSERAKPHPPRPRFQCVWCICCYCFVLVRELLAIEINKHGYCFERVTLMLSCS